MARKEVLKGEEGKPLLKEIKKGNEKAAGTGAGKTEKHVKIVVDEDAVKKAAQAEKKEQKVSAAQKIAQNTPNAFEAPSQSTQSLTPEGKELCELK
ncbi:unnamed protein product [Strongylus vulgaris]|uniref:Uncharacterized protein n=1 Tax=Strongylus vulgaris TaxID=40348 RepID=A0A3P7JQD9_STRVU|nr:unnamed protein product [Strongylus vulgaris]